MSPYFPLVGVKLFPIVIIAILLASCASEPGPRGRAPSAPIPEATKGEGIAGPDIRPVPPIAPESAAPQASPAAQGEANFPSVGERAAPPAATGGVPDMSASSRAGMEASKLPGVTDETAIQALALTPRVPIKPGQSHWRYRNNEGLIPVEKEDLVSALPPLAIGEPLIGGPAARPSRPSFGERALSGLSEALFEGKYRLRTWSWPDKEGSALVIVFPGLQANEVVDLSGSSALCLALMAREFLAVEASAGKDDLSSSVADLGAGLGILVEGPGKAIASRMKGLKKILETPAFMNPRYPEEDFQASLRDLRSSLRRRETRENPAGPLGSEKGLRDISLERVRAYWRTRTIVIEPSLVIIGNFDLYNLVIQNAFPVALDSNRLTIQTSLHQAIQEELLDRSSLSLTLGPDEFRNCPRAAFILVSEILADRSSGPMVHSPWRMDGEQVNLRLPSLGIEQELGALTSRSPLPSSSMNMGTINASFSSDRWESLLHARTTALARLFTDDPGGPALAMARDLAFGGDGGRPFALAIELDRVGQDDLATASRRIEFLLRSPSAPTKR